MTENFNNGRLGLKERGPVWKIKISIHSGVSDNSIQFFEKDKKLKLKIILN
jgi:hypothetical protein